MSDLKIDLGSEDEQHLNLPTILPSLKTTILSVHFFTSGLNASKLFELDEVLQKEKIHLKTGLRKRLSNRLNRSAVNPNIPCSPKT